MAKIGITVSADKKSISKVNHTVNDALKNEYNEYLRKIKTISLLKLITSLLGIIILLSAICFFTDIFLDFIPKSLSTYITIIITVFALNGILAVLLDVVRQKSTDIDQLLYLLYLTKGKTITYEDFAEYRISPFADKFKLYFMYYLAYTKPHILSVDVYVLQDSKNAVLNIVYVDGSTITSFTTKLIDILTDCNYINEPELHYDSDFKLFLPHNQLREYYRVNTEDFKALVDSFKLS